MSTFRESADSIERKLATEPIIRTINFHNTSRARSDHYEGQIANYSRNFSSVNEQELNDYLAKLPETFPPGLGYDQGVRMVAPEQLESIVGILLSWGYSSADMKALLGGNLMRLARAVWKPSKEAD